MQRIHIVALCAGVGACATDDRGEPAGPTGLTLTAVDATSGSNATEDDTAADTERLDLEQASGDTGAVRCAKIDLVFVVDNSASMYDEQQNLLASFPGFLTGIDEVLGDDDVHMMVVDTDVGENAGGCYESIYNSFDCDLWCSSNCPAGCNCECNSEPCAPFTPIPCDAELGAGRVSDAAGIDCGLGEQRWFTPQTADPVGTFDCVGRVGIEGEPQERPIMALHRAITDLAGAGACNEGFLRNDALLVVTLISDEDDSLASLGDPPQWYDDIISAKGGNENSVVVLALLGDPDLPDGLCPVFDPTDNSGAQPSTRLRAFTESFPFGFWSSVCQPDYSTFFSEVLATIDEACEVFVPVG